MNCAAHMLGKQNKDSLVKMLLHSSTDGQKLKEEMYVDTECEATSLLRSVECFLTKKNKTAAAMTIKTSCLFMSEGHVS